ncbi:MAG: hypothetical protein ACJ71B_02600 [Nitrososphaera sp.]
MIKKALLHKEGLFLLGTGDPVTRKLRDRNRTVPTKTCHPCPNIVWLIDTQSTKNFLSLI